MGYPPLWRRSRTLGPMEVPGLWVAVVALVAAVGFGMGWPGAEERRLLVEDSLQHLGDKEGY